MSHELRTPLNSLLILAKRLSDNPEKNLSPKQVEFARTIHGAGTDLLALISEILDLSKIGAGKMAVDIVKEVVDTLKAQVEESGAEIVIDALPSVSSDRNHLMQLFQNLIGNAIAYRGEKPPRIQISAEVQKFKGWTFSVRDNGIGFDMKHASEIFKMFKTMNSKGKGTGIGLAICKKIVEAHGGKIWVQSAPGVGTTFFFSIPDTSISDRTLEGLRVLIVDDAVEMRALASSILRGAGVTSDFASDGREGVEKARYGLYDVVLMDVMMPKLNGMEAAATLRKAGITSPIIAFTSMANDQRLQGSGFTDYLSKEDLVVSSRAAVRRRCFSVRWPISLHHRRWL